MVYAVARIPSSALQSGPSHHAHTTIPGIPPHSTVYLIIIVSMPVPPLSTPGCGHTRISCDKPTLAYQSANCARPSRQCS